MVAFVITPALAQAAFPHWYTCPPAKIIPEGVPTPLTTSGTLTFTVKENSGVTGYTGKCVLEDKETIENPVGGGAGEDEVTLLSPCKGKHRRRVLRP